MNTLLEMSNDMLLWLRDIQKNIDVNDKIRNRRKLLKKLRQVDVFLSFVQNWLQTRLYQSGGIDRTLLDAVKRSPE